MPTEAQTIIRVCTCVSMDTQRLTPEVNAINSHIQLRGGGVPGFGAGRSALIQVRIFKSTVKGCRVVLDFFVTGIL